ncbi:hypothetical protein [Streptomyces hyaluromycini]|uniref:hypothetical protein n=1 Tax=Streptomyces hyaluromycini TaxID=1377993 RepID=UPI000B5CB3FE|nr:hypothetical protein [Streptomyces hyaluromycini]
MTTNRNPRHPNPRLDLVAFLVVVTAGVVLLLCGVSTTALTAGSAALAALYRAWTDSRRRPETPARSRTEERDR